MDLGIAGRTALVCAASRGFGRAVAEQLAAEGAHVALVARQEGDLTAAELAVRRRADAAAAPGRVLARRADVTDPQAMQEVVAAVQGDLGPIDLLLVNAGGPPAGNFADISPSQWDEAYRAILAPVAAVCRLVLPGMMARGWGRIVQITSVSVRQPVENLLLSNVIRPATHALARCLALEAAPRGVTVNSVAPGFHTTSALDRLIARKREQTGGTAQDVVREWTRDIPVGRLGSPDELAALVVFLMSERAGYITGQCIVADGGWVRGTW